MPFYKWDKVPAEANRPKVTHRRLFGENIQVQQLIVEPGGEPSKPHSHPGLEQFFVIMEGEWEFTLDDEKRKVGPGDVIHVLPDQIHTARLFERQDLLASRNISAYLEQRDRRGTKEDGTANRIGINKKTSVFAGLVSLLRRAECLGREGEMKFLIYWNSMALSPPLHP